MKREAAEADSAAEDRAASRAMRRVSDADKGAGGDTGSAPSWLLCFWCRAPVLSLCTCSSVVCCCHCRPTATAKTCLQLHQPTAASYVLHITHSIPCPPPQKTNTQIESKAQVAKRRREAQQEFLYTIPVAPQVRRRGLLGAWLGAGCWGRREFLSPQASRASGSVAGLESSCQHNRAAVTVFTASYRLVSDTLLLLLLLLLPLPHLPGW